MPKFNFNPFPTLETERLVLRETTMDDLEEVHFLRSDKEVNRYIDRSPEESLTETEAFLNKVERETEAGTTVNWSIALKDDPTMIGSICLWNIKPDGTVGETGYTLYPEFQNRGIMTEAMQAVLQYGFEELELDEIEAYTHAENESSKRMLLKNNFTHKPERTDPQNPNNLIFTIKRRAYNS